MKTYQQKSDLLMRTFAFFCRFQAITVSSAAIRFMYGSHTTCCTYKDVFTRELLNTI